jgi:hypothetical protein
MRRRKILVGATLGILLVIGGGLAARYRMSRSAVGASASYGGAVEAKLVPDFPTADGKRWVNGGPTTLAAQRGQPILIEAWSPG